MTERIGFYICHCGINIAYRVRVKEVAEYAATLPNVVVSRDYLFMCSDPGQELLETDIRDHRLTRVIVASCSPRMHEKTFRAACRRAGLNPYRAFHMVSVREQVSWVTEDEDEATQKAKILAGAGVARVVRQQDLTPATFPVNTGTLIVGGGIAGMQASLDIAKSGFTAYLVERQPTIGGHMLQYDKTFPTLDCAACIGTPKMVSVGQESGIKLFSNSEVAEVAGFIGNFKVTVNKKARYVKDNCTGCGECEKVCPVESPNEWDVQTRMRKAIYRPFPQAVPITYTIEKFDRGPCVQACPAGTNVQAYVALVKMGWYDKAVKVIMERIPLPGTVGRICPAPCEKQCRRKELDTPLAIRELKRFAADQVDFSGLPLPQIEEKPEKIAVVGSGPAGLTAAYYLRLKGYQVTIFEAMETLGGMLRTGIPDFRLPSKVLDDEIGFLLRHGINAETGVCFGRDKTIESLKAEGFSAVFLGLGAPKAASLQIPGAEDAKGVVDAVSLLRELNLGHATLPGKAVAVIGGGNMAVDAARAVKRLGAETVTIVYGRGENEMPAYIKDVNAAREEGIDILHLTAPARIQSEGGAVTGLACIKTELGSPDESGRRRPKALAETEFVIPCDAVIPALGRKTDVSWTDQEKGLALTFRHQFSVDRNTLQTSEPGVFAAGDAVTGPATVIDAIANGHRAVMAIDQYIQGRDLDNFQMDPDFIPEGNEWKPIPEDVETAPRTVSTWLAPENRVGSFEEADLGFDEASARKEAARCVDCGGCCECKLCVEACEARAIDHRMTDARETIDVGSIIVATGFDPLDPTPMVQYGYGRLANVFTNLEFERLSNATGPTKGKLLKRDPANRLNYTDPPKSVAILHCIGSRDINYHEYCSRTCCMYALKYAHLLKDKCGHDTEVYNFYIDMRCFGKGYEEFYKRVQAEGVRMIRGKAARIEEEDGMLVVTAEDTLSGAMVNIGVEMVILCTAMEPRTDVNDVARTFGIAVGGDGFFLEEHPKLEPVSTASSGVFLAGACQGPKDIPDTVAQAKGAAAEALALSAKGKVSVDPMISFIDPDVCIGCQICIGLCPYTAIEFNERKGISEVNEAVCKGCGSCSGFCPSGAAKVKHFTDRQIFSEIDGLMAG